MEITDTVEAAPSADNGNVPVDAPSQQTQPQLPDAGTEPDGNVAPTETQPVVPTEPVAQLYELPDGRKVNAETLTKEWKENFLPDYTRKSQALAQQKQPINNDNSNTPPANPYADPNYVPKNYEEIIQVAQARALEQFEQKQQSEIQRYEAVENEVTQQLNDIKTADPTVNENALFLHATKYGFTDLKAAHQNMKDMFQMTKNAQQQTQQNMQRRANEPVATQPGKNSGTMPDPSAFSNARDYLRSIGGK